ncbi:unnamed protein product, partial [Effrenium voratum]
VIKMIENLKQIFKFREWKDGNNLEYCGAHLNYNNDGTWRFHHKTYFTKVKPITVAKGRKPEDVVTDKERNLLRSLLGALQWPATQSSPHLQVHTSMLSGETSEAVIETTHSANKALRFAKVNDDVGLIYRPLGEFGDLCLIAWSDAAFANRKDLTSQGGYLVALVPLVHRDVVEKGLEGYYHILDWRSFKLPRLKAKQLRRQLMP